MAPNHQLPDIPLEIILIILSNLPIKHLCRFKSVSKPWLAMINHLIETRLENKEKLIIASNTYPCSFYSINPQSPNESVEIKSFSEHWFKILGSCNGVLLLQSSCSTLFFWNPLTRTHRLIPSLGTFRLTVIQGLGYDSIRNDFKVVMAISHTGNPELSLRRTCAAYVFSSLSCSWKRIGDFRYYTRSGAAPSGVVLNGSPHWILSRIRSDDMIVYFDPYEETFEELPIPVLGSGFYITRLTVSGGILCGVRDNVDNSIDVWVMKGSSWSKLFVVPSWQGEFSARVLTPLCFMGEEDVPNGEVIIQLNSRALALYCLDENRFERIELPQDCERFSAISYVETLASP